jgi:hypothetical protein
MRRSPLAAATIAWILRRLKDIAEIGSDIRRTAITDLPDGELGVVTRPAQGADMT